jgi:hypothetical protein
MSVAIPRSVETLAAKSFADCQSLSRLLFEHASQLKRIESQAFTGTHIASVTLPGDVLVVAGDAFPAKCEIVADADPQLAEWVFRRKVDREANFERETRNRIVRPWPSGFQTQPVAVARPPSILQHRRSPAKGMPSINRPKSFRRRG